MLLRLLCFTSQRGVVRWKVYRGLGDPRVAGGEESAAGCSASSRGKAGGCGRVWWLLQGEDGGERVAGPKYRRGPGIAALVGQGILRRGLRRPLPGGISAGTMGPTSGAGWSGGKE